MSWLCILRSLLVSLSAFFLLHVIAAIDDNAVSAALSPTPAFEPAANSNQTSSVGGRVASLSAAALTTLCFGDSAPGLGNGGEPFPLFTNTTTPLQLERIEDAPNNVDVRTLARYTLTEAFLDPSKPVNSTLVVPLADDIVACAPDPDVAIASLEVLSACQTQPSDDPDEEIVFLIQWGARLACTNSVVVLRGSELDVSVGSVLVVSSTEPISIEKLFVSSL